MKMTMKDGSTVDCGMAEAHMLMNDGLAVRVPIPDEDPVKKAPKKAPVKKK